MNRRGFRVYCGASPEKGEAGVALAEHADPFELTECLWKIESAAVLGDHEGAGRKERHAAKKGKDAVVFVGGSIRRIEENDVEWSARGSIFRGDTLQTPQRVEFENACVSADSQRIEILLNERGSGRMVLDKYDFSGAATEGFDAHGASACEDIQEAAAGDAFSKNVKE